jgi:predicted secreted hydrolase
MPFRAWIDAWQMRALDGFDASNVAPLELSAYPRDFSYTLKLTADRPLVLQGDGGFSKKSEREQASYYYSQPFFKVTGTCHRRQAVASRALPGWTANGAASRWPRPERLGLVRAAFRRRRKS